MLSRGVLEVLSRGCWQQCLGVAVHTILNQGGWVGVLQMLSECKPAERTDMGQPHLYRGVPHQNMCASPEQAVLSW